MTKAIKERPTSTDHSEVEVSRVLAAFANQQEDREFLAEKLLKELLAEGSENNLELMAGMNDSFVQMSGARRFTSNYLGHMLTEVPIPALVANLLSTELGSNTVAPEVSMVETRLEHQSMGHILDIIGYDKEKASGTFCSGGTMANFTALAVARKEMEAKYEQAGTRFPDEVWVLTTDMAHYSIPKAVDLLGGPNHNIKIQTLKTCGLKMSLDDLRNKIREAESKGIPVMAIIGIMGETETGLVDDGVEINRIACENEIFTIGDAAYGAPYRLSRVGDKFDGLPEYDAVVFDVHKNLYGPYNGSSGAVCFKDARKHAGLAKGVKANYIGINMADKSEEFEKDRPRIAKSLIEGTAGLGSKRIEGSGGAGGILVVKAMMDTLGREGLQTSFDMALDRINHLHARLKESTYLRPFHDPELNLLCFTLRDDVLAKLNLDGHSEAFHCFITKTRHVLDNDFQNPGGYYFSETDLLDETDTKERKLWTWRACIMNPWTTDGILDDAVDNLEKLIFDAIEARTG
ncbi:MAG: pyridoxal-dependent decarboxylase [Microgenomates group bacterium]